MKKIKFHQYLRNKRQLNSHGIIFQILILDNLKRTLSFLVCYYRINIWWIRVSSRTGGYKWDENIHGETSYINFYNSIFQFREKRITLRIFVGKNTKPYNNGMKL